MAPMEVDPSTPPTKSPPTEPPLRQRKRKDMESPSVVSEEAVACGAARVGEDLVGWGQHQAIVEDSSPHKRPAQGHEGPTVSQRHCWPRRLHISKPCLPSAPKRPEQWAPLIISQQCHPFNLPPALPLCRGMETPVLVIPEALWADG